MAYKWGRNPNHVSVRLGSPSSLRSSLVGALSKTLAALTERVEQMEGKGGTVTVEAERWNRWDGYWSMEVLDPADDDDDDDVRTWVESEFPKKNLKNQWVVLLIAQLVFDDDDDEGDHSTSVCLP